jgi:CelD/BcsL family acetyltransferase involved in cellulose biosynthesis
MPHLIKLTLSELVDQAKQWDDLWDRSEARLPSQRAEGIKLWCQSFAPGAPLTALVVEQDKKFIAALPLVKVQLLRWFTVYRLPSNCTVNSGDLLIDPNCDAQLATQLLARQITKLPGILAAFENIEIQSERWQRLIDALRSANRELHISPGHDVGVIDIFHDWEAYTGSWSRNHRRSINRSQKKLEAAGDVQVLRLRDPSDQDLYETLEACFAIEDLGWKGESGTSILKTPRLRQYYHQEARMMRDLGMLDLWLLKLNDQIIAFDYSQLAKNVSFSHKISFDPAWEKYSPGRALQRYQLERYHQDPSVKQVDTLGVLCEVKAKWTTRSYKSSRCFVAVGGRWSNLLLRGFKWVRGLARRLRRVEIQAPTIKHGAESYLQLENKPQASAEPNASIAPQIICGSSALHVESTPV